jgi:transposase
MKCTHARASVDAAANLPALDSIEEILRTYLAEPNSSEGPPAGASRRGRPETLPAAMLWSALLVCILRGFRTQLEIWRLVTQWGLWHFPSVDVTPMAVYKRLERAPADAMKTLFERVARALGEKWPDVGCVPYAEFAEEIVAVDQTTLDPLLRKLKILRDAPEQTPGKPRKPLLGGALRCVFDLRRQRWLQVDYLENPHQNERNGAETVLETLVRGTLLLFDLGYFSFPWLDKLTDLGYHFVARIPKKVTYELAHVHFSGGNFQTRLLDALIYLGAYRADRAAHAVRLIEIGVGGQTYRYLTNVLDPRVLPAWQVAGLYQRRWDIETAFNLIKTHLGLHLLFSAHAKALLQQIYATFVIAQVVLGLRAEIAKRAGADLREVSVALLVRHLPMLAADGKDPVEMYVSRGRAAGCIRPFRGKPYIVLPVEKHEYMLPEAPPPKRTPRYAGKVGGGPNKNRSRRTWRVSKGGTQR